MTRNDTGAGEMKLVPISFKEAKEFIKIHHRHNKPPTGWKFGVAVEAEGRLVGVATVGRPVARMLDDGSTLEVNRTCTDGYPNANSMLYGAVWRAAKALGYTRCITYTQADETGASLRAVGWRRVKELAARGSWADSSVALKGLRDPVGNGGVGRIRWEITARAALEAELAAHTRPCARCNAITGATSGPLNADFHCSTCYRQAESALATATARAEKLSAMVVWMARHGVSYMYGHDSPHAIDGLYWWNRFDDSSYREDTDGNPASILAAVERAMSKEG